MKVTRFIFFVFFCISGVYTMAQKTERTLPQSPDSTCITPMEHKLYSMINSYRRRYDLPPIPLSKSLCFVATAHVRDLFFHHPDQGSCNSHSWSDQGTWKPFCYPRDENKKNSVWDKPKELTTYKGKGFEIVYWENNAVVIDSIITFWKSMDYFNNFLMNTGKWQGRNWNAIGIGIHENYACAWFGELVDIEGEPYLCGEEPKKTINASQGKPVIPEKKVAVKNDSVKKNVAAKPASEVKKNPKPSGPITITDNMAGKEYYYIIVKGLAPDKELQRFLMDLHSKGYTTARILEKNGKQRVSIMEFPDKSKADSALRQVRKTWQDAWILQR